MNITIVHRFFWPHNYPYAQMLKHIACGLADNGHEVSVLTTHESDEDIQNRKALKKESAISSLSIKVSGGRGISPLRKLFDAAYFGAWVFFQLLKEKPDTVMVATTPPVMMAMIVRLASKLGKFNYIYHCQDIHPEAMVLNGILRNSFLIRWLVAIDRKNINQAKYVIVLSEDMKKTLMARVCPAKHIKVINNFIYQEKSCTETVFEQKSTRTRFLFAGTMGSFQNLEILMDAILCFKERKDVEFHFMGEGRSRKSLESKAVSQGAKNIHFLGQRSVKEAVLAMGEADYGIVSLAPHISEVAYPSKVMMYLSNGLPLFAIIDEESELNNIINQNKLGLSVAADSVNMLVSAIEKAITYKQENRFSRRKISMYAEKHFGKDVVIEKFLEAFKL